MYRADSSRSSSWAAVFLAAVLGLALVGCGARSEIVLHQPFAPASQQNLKLSSKTAYRAVVGEQQNCVLTFPLPRSAAGARAFVLYFTAPDRLGKVPVAPFEPQAAGGFLIQEVGDLAGRSDFLAGGIAFGNVWPIRNLRRADFNVRCEDGTEITGRAYLKDVPRQVRAIEREFAADVRLVSSPEHPRGSDVGTTRRGAAATDH